MSFGLSCIGHVCFLNQSKFQVIQLENYCSIDQDYLDVGLLAKQIWPFWGWSWKSKPDAESSYCPTDQEDQGRRDHHSWPPGDSSELQQEFRQGQVPSTMTQNGCFEHIWQLLFCSTWTTKCFWPIVNFFGVPDVWVTVCWFLQGSLWARLSYLYPPYSPLLW